MSICALSVPYFVLCGGIVLLVLLLLRYLVEKIQLPDLSGKPVLITGCDTGFGHDLALKCLANGMPVFAGCLTKQGANDLKAASISLPGRLVTFILDVTSQESVDNAKKIVCEHLQDSGLHGIVNNAGISGNSGLDDWLTVEDYQQVVDVNTFGVIRVTHAFKDLVKLTKGRITTVASICGRVSLWGLGPYTVSKFAVSAYCDVLRQEMRAFGVKVSILEPGFFKTPMVNEKRVTAVLERVWAQQPDARKVEYVKKITSFLLGGIASKRTDKVVDAYFHSLTAVFPRKRYQIGYDANFWFIPFSMLPTDVQDFIHIILFKILRIPKPASMQRNTAAPRGYRAGLQRKTVTQGGYRAA